MTAEDLDAAERRLVAAARGELDTDDPVAELLAALLTGVDEPLEPSAAELAAFVEAVQAGSGPGLRSVRRLVPALVIGGSLLLGGAAAAASGSLPGPVQDVVHDLADAVGVEVPAAHEPPDNRGGVDGIGSEGTPPGQGGTVPGTGEDGGGNGVGSDGTPPGQGGVVPGTGEEGGGQGTGGGEVTPPAQSGTVPSTTPATPTTRATPTTPTPPTTPTTPAPGGGQGGGQGGGGNPNG